MGESRKVRGLWYAVAIWGKDAPGMAKLIVDWMTDGRTHIDHNSIDYARFQDYQLTEDFIWGRCEETAKKISKDVRDNGFKKVQISIHGDELRVTSGSRDSLQEVMAFVRGNDYGVELSFGNYR